MLLCVIGDVWSLCLYLFQFYLLCRVFFLCLGFILFYHRFCPLSAFMNSRFISIYPCNLRIAPFSDSKVSFRKELWSVLGYRINPALTREWHPMGTIMVWGRTSYPGLPPFLGLKLVDLKKGEWEEWEQIGIGCDDGKHSWQDSETLLSCLTYCDSESSFVQALDSCLSPQAKVF